MEVANKQGDVDEIGPRSALARVAMNLVDIIEMDEFFYLDFSDAIGPKTMTQIVRQVAGAGLMFVPVISPEKPRQTKVFAETVGFTVGACIRLALTGRIRRTGQSLNQLIDELLAHIGVSTAEADLVFDLRHIGQIPGYGSDDIKRAIDEVDEIDRFRNVVLTGTSIPDTLAAIGHDSMGELRRHEWIFWHQLQAMPLRRHPSFGDYIVQAPRRPAGMARAVANIRYTSRDQVIIARGHRLAKGDHEQYRTLCRQLAARREFRGSSFSWGDDEIATYARGGQPPLGQEHWRAIGTSHHIEDVVDSLRS